MKTIEMAHKMVDDGMYEIGYVGEGSVLAAHEPKLTTAIATAKTMASARRGAKVCVCHKTAKARYYVDNGKGAKTTSA